MNNGKLRLAFLYECRFRNDGPPLYLKTAFARNLEELGLVEVRHYVPGDEYRGGKFDWFIWPDHGEDALPVPQYKCPSPSIYWCSDSHLGIEYRLNKAKEFDVVFLTIQKHIPIFKEHLGHNRVYWLPHAGEPTCYKPESIVKKYDVCFVGYLPTEERIVLLDRLFKEFPNFWYGQRFFEEASHIYSMSKIAFNCSVADEANMRAFEIPLSGTLLLTDYSRELVELGFKDNVNVVFYSDEKEMVDKVRFFLKEDVVREKIAKAGYELVLKQHTYLDRAKKIMEIVRSL